MGRMFFFHKSNSGEIARRRLKQVLVSDQSGCSPGLIDEILPAAGNQRPVPLYGAGFRKDGYWSYLDGVCRDKNTHGSADSQNTDSQFY